MWRIFPQQPTMHLKNGKMQWIQPAGGSVLVDDGFCYFGASHSVTPNSQIHWGLIYFKKKKKKGKGDPGLPIFCL